jgi:hypothetical protein
MAITSRRHDDIVIQRRLRAHDATRPVQQVYAVTYPDHLDQGTERDRYEDAERTALELAEARGLTVWYEENPQDGRWTLVQSFRSARA